MVSLWKLSTAMVRTRKNSLGAAEAAEVGTDCAQTHDTVRHASGAEIIAKKPLCRTRSCVVCRSVVLDTPFNKIL